MRVSLNEGMGAAFVNGNSMGERTPFGKEMAKHFLFGPGFKNLNHGSFGAIPRAIRDKHRELQDKCEAAPDPFIRYTTPEKLAESHKAIAKVLHAPVEGVVLVPNATQAFNTVLRNFAYHEDGRDEILYFNTIYGACGKTIDYTCEINRHLVSSRVIQLTYPISDSDVVTHFKEAIKASRTARKVPRMAVFDTVSSTPGLRMPFERLTQVCREEGILSIIDGAHGIGHIHLDISALDPDFFFSNAHKWLFVPRACAVFYVPVRNQGMIRSSLPTSHGFVPKEAPLGAPSTLPPAKYSEFINNFEFVGTVDNTNYLMIDEVVKWRKEVCGGEEAIMEYNSNLARKGGKLAAEVLGTEVLDNAQHTLTDCCMVNVLLPLELSESPIHGKNTVNPAKLADVTLWMEATMMQEYNTFIAIFHLQGKWWARLSGQVYLDLEDFEWAARRLKELCERASREKPLNSSRVIMDENIDAAAPAYVAAQEG